MAVFLLGTVTEREGKSGGRHRQPGESGVKRVTTAFTYIIK